MSCTNDYVTRALGSVYIMPHTHPADTTKRIHIFFSCAQKFNNFESRNNKTRLYKKYFHSKAHGLKPCSQSFREENKT